MDITLDIAQLAIIGVTTGAIYSIGAVGLTISYGVMKFPNISHGYLMAMAVYLVSTATVTWGLGSANLGNLSFGWAFLAFGAAAALISGLLAVAVDLVVFRTIRNRGYQSVVTLLIASIGVAIALQAVILAVWGGARYRLFTGVVRSLEGPYGLRVHGDDLFTVGITIAMALLLYLLLYHTRLGKSMRATTENDKLAEVVGIDTGRVRMATWFISGSLAGVAGLLFGIQLGAITLSAGFTLLLPIIAATILGGIGSPWGALLAGLLIGVTQEVSVQWIDSGFKPVVPFAVMILVLLVRPQGLLGRRAN